MANIGIMGGTFDPIHNGHLYLGREAKSEFGLDEVWFMPSGQPPHKKDHKITDSRFRYMMVKLAVEACPDFIPSDFEIKRKGNTYTAQTLMLLKEHYPQHNFFFIIGADSLFEIESWRTPEKVMSLATILVAGRNYEKPHCSLAEQIDYLNQKYQGDVRMIHCEPIDISSASIRAMAAQGSSLAKVLPPSVFGYIQQHKLYQETINILGEAE